LNLSDREEPLKGETGTDWSVGLQHNWQQCGRKPEAGVGLIQKLGEDLDFCVGSDVTEGGTDTEEFKG
jgi:hypothetical protein